MQLCNSLLSLKSFVTSMSIHLFIPGLRRCSKERTVQWTSSTTSILYQALQLPCLVSEMELVIRGDHGFSFFAGTVDKNNFVREQSRMRTEHAVFQTMIAAGI